MRKLCGFAGLAVICLAAFAADAADIAPKGGWNVGPIQAKSQDGRGYCSMKSSYEGGVSLVFARDALGSNSVAVELPQDKFDAGKQYPLHLSIGPIERQAKALAVGKKVLVVQMGADDMFYEMLAKKSVLSVKSDPVNFSFGLQGTSKALMALDNCAAEFSSGGKPKHVKVGLPAVFSSLDEGFDPPITGSRIVTGGDVVIKVTHPVTETPLEREFGDGEASLEVERLKAENRALELENQAIQERLKAAELARQQESGRIEASFAEKEKELQKENEKLKKSLAPTRTDAVGVRAGVKDMLLRAQAASGSNVIRTSGEAYSWQSGGVYGAAEEYPWTAGRNFKAVAENYISSTGEKCKGDFAYTLGDVKKIGVSETAEAEIACIDGKNDAAAALLFVADAGKFIVITHEGPTDQMASALEKRAQVSASLR